MDKTHYRSFRIRKSRGGYREILEPEPELKARQHAILKWLLARRLRPSKYAHGFIKGRSTRTNAQEHVGKKVIVRIDIQNFFPTITAQQVVYALIKEGLTRDDAEKIAETCTVDCKLPQGSPTSPFLSNVIFKSLDYRLAGLAKSWKASYSRYADDLIFSGNHPHLNHIFHPVQKILEDGGFQINTEKFRVYRSGNRQLVTGIVVNRGLNIPRHERRVLRAALHNARIAIVNGKDISAEELRVLEGKAAYLSGIHPEQGRRAMQSLHDVKSLLDMRHRMLVH